MKPERRSSQAASLCHRRASLLLLSPHTPTHTPHTLPSLPLLLAVTGASCSGGCLGLECAAYVIELMPA